MSRYDSERTARFDQQFSESQDERNERHRANRVAKNFATLKVLIADLSDALTDEGPDWSQTGLDNLRKRVANALGPEYLPTWLEQYRDPPIVQS